jgi:Fur family transcriptional regulator, ferric uptake regulator
MKIEAQKSDEEGALREAGLRKTAQRLAVLNILNSADCPLTANDILLRLGSPQKVNRVTVYRILSSYTRKGMIREFESKRGIHYYERASSLAPSHPHFICRDCGTMICMTTFVPSDPWDQLIDQHGVSIEHISISGLCRLCRCRNQ